MGSGRASIRAASVCVALLLTPIAARPQATVSVERHGAVASAVVEFTEVARASNAFAEPSPPSPHAHPSVPLALRRPGAPAAPAPAEAGDIPPAETSGPSPGLAASFAALGDDGHYIPPDSNGAAGPSHLVVALNSEIRIQSRSGAALYTAKSKAFWASLGNPNPFDPRVVYDPYGRRFILSAGGDAESSNAAILLAVSRSSDPTGGWYLYRLAADSSRRVWADYPRLGFNRSWIVVQANGFDIDNGSFHGSRVYAIDKDDAYANFGADHALFVDPNGATQIPATTHDGGLGTMYLVEDAGSALRVSSITGSVGSEVFNAGIAYALPPFGWADMGNGTNDFAPQLGSSHRIATNDSRVGAVVYRNGSLWVAQTIFLPASGPSRAAVAFWQIAPGGGVLQFGRVDDPTGNVFYAFPSIAVNRHSDVLIGYSRFSASSYAGAAYSFRAGNDPASTLRIPATLKNGEAPYYKTFGGPSNRWGDYSATVVDPVDDTTMWTIQEYAAAPSGGSDRWGTWWGAVKPPPWSGTPGISISPGSVSFPQLLVGQTGEPVTVTVTNSGTAPLRISGVGVTGTNAAEFSKVYDQCTGIAVPVQGRCFVKLTFGPKAGGTRTAVLSIADDAAGSPHLVSLSGTALADSGPPVSKFTTTDGDIVSGFSMIEGFTTDDAAGVASVRVHYVDASGLITETDPAEPKCSPSKTLCSWQAGTPLIPGIYTARAIGRDFAGNTESPGPTVQVIVL